MKILIVDDESLVRTGLKNSINWETLGISTVLLAEDGIQALRIAQQQRPEIILTDVRMQRMDGIRLATRLRQELPDSRLIFMSGYSDKEYLKAAIQLKAVSYVEKPIICAEIEEAVKEAVRLWNEQNSNQTAQIVRSRVEKENLVLALTNLTQENEASIRKTWDELKLPSGSKLYFSTVLVNLTNLPVGGELPQVLDCLSALQELAQKKHLSFLYSGRGGNRLLLHVYAAQELTREHIAWFCLQLQKLLVNRFQFFIAAGMPVRGIHQINLSYQSAVESLNGGFYDDLNAVLLWNEKKENPVVIDFDGYVRAFRNAISSAEYDNARRQEQLLYQAVLRQRQLPTDIIKNTYYQFICVLEWIATKGCIPFPQTEQAQSAWKQVSGSRTVYELHTYFTALLEQFVALAAKQHEENEVVYLMKEYIRKNYQRDQLSVREIAEAACLSTAYACTMFKNETGSTINQFISNYRVEKAKQLLADPRMKITDIAAQLGYSDSNYFGKSFKRIIGLSPSEYREKVSKWDL